ncbi:MAG: hypothetical protein AAFO69_13220 [Bacteroidota bacterium]
MKNINLLNHGLNFVAVILGVFLAFYVDACSERQKDKIELRETVLSLVNDLDNDHEIYSESQIPKNEEQLADLEEFIGEILEQNESDSNQSSVDFNIDSYSPTSSTYLSLTSSGRINLIDDLAVRKELSNYYDILSSESVRRGELQVEFLLNQILPWMIENTNLLDVTSEQLRGENTLANQLVLYSALINNKLEHYRVVDEASIELRKMLDELLNE